MKHLAFILLIFNGLHPVFSQKSISPAAVLSSAIADPSVATRAQHSAFHRDKIEGLAWVDQVSIRSETNRFLLSRQEYLARLNVNGFLEKRQYNRLQNINVNLSSITVEQQWLYALYDRYLYLSDYQRLEKEIDIQNQLLTVQGDKIRVLESLAVYNADADPDELMKTEYERDELKLAIAKNTTERSQMLELLGVWLATDAITSVDTSGMMPPELMYQLVSGRIDSTFQHPSILEKEAKIALLKAEYRLENSRSLQMLDFFQVRYGNRPQALLNEKVSVSVGITLPFNGTRSAKKNTLLIEQDAAEQELLALRSRLSLLISDAYHALDQSYTQRNLLLAQIKEAAERYDPAQLAASGKNAPRLLLQLKEMQLRRQLKLQSAEQDLQKNYLKILFLTGRLIETPQVNYLDAQLSGF